MEFEDNVLHDEAPVPSDFIALECVDFSKPIHFPKDGAKPRKIYFYEK